MAVLEMTDARRHVIRLLGLLWAGHPLDAVATAEQLVADLGIDPLAVEREAARIRRRDTRVRRRPNRRDSGGLS